MVIRRTAIALLLALLPAGVASATHGGQHELVVVDLSVASACNGGPALGMTFTLSWVPTGFSPLELLQIAPDSTLSTLGAFSPPVTLTRTLQGPWEYSVFAVETEPNGDTTTYQSGGVTVQVPSPLAPDCPPAGDADGDLMPDPWERAWGLNPNDPADGALDPDGDRLTNVDEFWAGTNPTAYSAAAAMSDRQLLDLFAGKAFLYFWEQSRPYYFFTADNADYDNPAVYSGNFNSIATTGFGILSYVIADERGWLAHEAAYERIRALLSRAVELQSPTYDVLEGQGYPQGNRRGYLYHFVDDYGFKSGPGVEISSIDHALFVAGALAAGEYYKGTEVEQLAQQLYLNTDWNWLFDVNGVPFLWQSWREPVPCESWQTPYDNGCAFDQWNRYSELLVLMFLAMGHPDQAQAVPASAWTNLTYGTGVMFPFEYAHLVNPAGPQAFSFVPNMPDTLDAPGFQNSATELHFIFAGSLHNHQYSHLFADFRSRPDGLGTNYFNNSISATLANRQYSISLNAAAYGGDPGSPDPTLQQPYETYGPDSWGLMAGVASDGFYKVLQPITKPDEDFSPEHLAINNDSGTVVLSAPLGSVPFAPREAVDFARNLLGRFQAFEPGYDGNIGRYGFRNAYNLGRTYTGQIGHFPPQVIGLDMGPAVASHQNFLNGLVWKFAMRDEFLQAGMQVAGFSTGPVEPFILNFDDNPPAPHEDPNGGGADPNSFGGASFAFGTGTVQYVNIGDPRPDIPFGPQDWAQQITATNNADDGAFTTLNNHSVSHWDRVSFWIRGQSGGEDYAVGLKGGVVSPTGESLEAVEVKLPIRNYHVAGQITDVWTEVRVPLRDFMDQGVRMTALDNISFTNLAPGGGTISVDDIAFLGDEFGPAAPQGLAATTDGLTATLTWSPSPEPDVVGYRVYRSTDGVNFSPLNSQLVVAPAYTDPAGAVNDRYYVTAVDHASAPNESAPSPIVIPNQAPVANAGADQEATAGGSAALNGCASSDPDGDALTYAWRDAGGALLGATCWLQVPGPGSPGQSVYTLTVSDGRLSAQDSVTITWLTAVSTSVAIQSPAIGATVDRTQPIPLSGTATARDDTLVTSMSVEVLNISQTPNVLVHQGPVTILTPGVQTVSWQATLPADLAPGATLRVRVLATTTPVSNTGLRAFRIDAAGKVLRNSTSSKLLCTHLAQQGLMPHAWWVADEAFAQRVVDAPTLAAYQAWAAPTVTLLEHSRVATAIAQPLVRAWAQHMAFVMGAHPADNRLGRWLSALGLPLQRWVGRRWGVK